MDINISFYNVGDIVYCLYDNEPYKGRINSQYTSTTTEDFNVTYSYTIALFKKGTNEEWKTVSLDECKFISTSSDEFEAKISYRMNDINGLDDIEPMKDICVHKYRMYVLVERHLSAIDKGIQAAHAIVEYGWRYDKEDDYNVWRGNNQTIILLNGGTSDDLSDTCSYLDANGVNVACFNEEDLNSAVTAVAFLADERAYDTGRFKDYTMCSVTYTNNKGDSVEVPYEEPYNKEKWLKIIGGASNEAIRNVLKDKHLAR